MKMVRKFNVIVGKGFREKDSKVWVFFGLVDIIFEEYKFIILIWIFLYYWKNEVNYLKCCYMEKLGINDFI